MEPQLERALCCFFRQRHGGGGGLVLTWSRLLRRWLRPWNCCAGDCPGWARCTERPAAAASPTALFCSSSLRPQKCCNVSDSAVTGSASCTATHCRALSWGVVGVWVGKMKRAMGSGVQSSASQLPRNAPTLNTRTKCLTFRLPPAPTPGWAPCSNAPNPVHLQCKAVCPDAGLWGDTGRSAPSRRKTCGV